MGIITQWAARVLSPRAVSPPSATAAAIIGTTAGRAAKRNVEAYRAWAKTPWIRGAIDIRKDQIASADFEIGPYDVNAKYSKRLAKEITAIFRRPNPEQRSFRAFISPVIDDLLTLDAGVSEGVTDSYGDLRQIWPVDAGKVRVSTVWSGEESEPRYFWYPDGYYHGVNWKNTEMSYMMTNPNTYTKLGISKLEILAAVIARSLNADDYNGRMVSNPVPDGLLHLGEGVPEDKVESFRSKWYEQLASSGALAIIGGAKNPSFTNFRASNRDMQFLEWQEWLVRQIALVFGESVQDLQLMFNINRSEGDVQQQLSEDRGLRPLADLIQDELTQEYVWHECFGGPENNLAFRFTRLNIHESTQKANINKVRLAGFPYGTANEARIDEGREPIGDPNDENNPFNQVIANTPLGMVRIPMDPTAIPTPAEMASLKSQPAARQASQPEAPAPANAATEAPVSGGKR
jgi:hypothetical protein